jgi:O-antigen/teichoic acid export membrane protein
MGSWHTLLRTFGALATGETLARLLGLVAVIVMARRLSPGGFGVIALGVTLTNWFRLVVDGGTELLAVRDVARRPSQLRAIAEPILGLRLALSVVAVVVFAGAAVVVASEPSDREILLLFGLSLPTIALNMRFMVLGVRSSKAVALGNIASQLVVAAGVVVLVQGLHDGPVIPILIAGGELLYGLVIVAAVAPRFGIPRPRVDLAEWRRTLRASGPIMANSFARAVVYSADLILIAAVLTRREVGLYAAAYRPILFFSGLVALFSTSFLTSYSAAGPSAHRLFRKSALSSAAVAFPIAVALSVSAPIVVSLAFGSAYSGAVASLAILAWTVPLLTLSMPYANALIAGNHQAALMRQNIAGALFNIAANLVAIPVFGIQGAAVTTVLSLGLVLFLNWRSAVGYGVAPPGPVLWGRPAQEVQP